MSFCQTGCFDIIKLLWRWRLLQCMELNCYGTPKWVWLKRPLETRMHSPCGPRCSAELLLSLIIYSFLVTKKKQMCNALRSAPSQVCFFRTWHETRTTQRRYCPAMPWAPRNLRRLGHTWRQEGRMWPGACALLFPRYSSVLTSWVVASTHNCLVLSESQ